MTRLTSLTSQATLEGLLLPPQQRGWIEAVLTARPPRIRGRRANASCQFPRRLKYGHETHTPFNEDDPTSIAYLRQDSQAGENVVSLPRRTGGLKTVTILPKEFDEKWANGLEETGVAKQDRELEVRVLTWASQCISAGVRERDDQGPEW